MKSIFLLSSILPLICALCLQSPAYATDDEDLSLDLSVDPLAELGVDESQEPEDSKKNKDEDQAELLWSLPKQYTPLFEYSLLTHDPSQAWRQIFVSPQGHDANPGTVSLPLKTLDRAKTIAGALSKMGTGSVQIFFRAGEYLFERPTVFNPEDSGTEQSPIIYRNFPNESPVFTAGFKIQEGVQGHWEKQPFTFLNQKTITLDIFKFSDESKIFLREKIREAAARGDNAGAFTFSSLFEETFLNSGELKGRKGYRLTRARYPNRPTRVDSRFLGQPHLKSTVRVSYRRMSNLILKTFKPGRWEFNLIRQWQFMKGVVGNIRKNGAYAAIDIQHLPITTPSWVIGTPAAKKSMRVAELHPTISSILANAKTPMKSLGWFENDIQFLDMPGEWYFDEETITLYMVPREGKNPRALTFIVPMSAKMIEIAGHGPIEDPRYVENLRFQGLQFQHSGWRYQNGAGNSDYLNYSSNAYGQEGAINGNFVRNIEVIDNRFFHLGGNAISLTGHRTDFHSRKSNSVSSVQKVRVLNNEFADIGANAITLDHRLRKPPEPALSPTELDQNVISKNKIYSTGQISPDSTSIFFGFYHQGLVSQNHIQDAPYSGMRVGWDCRQDKNDRTDIIDNTVVRVMSLLADGGGIYVNGGQSIVYRNNLRSALPPSTGGKKVGVPMPALYLDDATQYTQAILNASPTFLVKSARNRVYRSGANVLEHEPRLQQSYRSRQTHACNPMIPNPAKAKCAAKFGANHPRCVKLREEIRSKFLEAPDWR